MGETVPFRPGQATRVRVPSSGDSLERLLRDRAVILEAPGDALLSVLLPRSGVCRVEVDLFHIGDVACRPWIFSNAVRVRG